MKVKTRKGGPITIEEEELDKVEKFTHQRSIISKTGGSRKDIKARISKAQQAWRLTTGLQPKKNAYHTYVR